MKISRLLPMCVRCVFVSETSESHVCTKAKLEDAAEARTECSNKVNGWKKKLVDEEAKVKEAEEIAETLQTEFKVGHPALCSSELRVIMGFCVGMDR